jgi:hypothetical protein
MRDACMIPYNLTGDVRRLERKAIAAFKHRRSVRAARGRPAVAGARTRTV